MHRMLRGAFQRSAKLLMAKSRSKLLIYPSVLIGVSAAAAAATDTHISFRKDVLRLGIQAKLRGMSVPEFLDYARKEKQYCKEMCAKCKDVPLPPGCEWNQETVDKYCGRWMVL
ncbi:uncharacterized protein LOC141661465 isoform X3 [Apium graveolens]|uniref:uncharacterized protein LOC141661465 isoform X3 n=1 Tax=Apium graveolens TaxID=4045 RepID=UPI003D7A6D36